MKSQTLINGKWSDSMVLAVVLVSTVYWVLDSILNIFFSNKFNLIAQLVGPDLYDIYIRVVVLCLLVILGSHAQSIINRLNEAKQKLNESEELWRSLVETAPDIIMTVDQQGAIRFINHPLNGNPPHLVTRRSLYDFLPEEYRETARDILINVFRTGETDTFEVCLQNQRVPVWFTYRVGPLRLDRRVIAATIIATETTEFKRAEELVRYKEVFDNVAEGVFMLNRSGRFMEANGRLQESTGYSPAELAGFSLTDLAAADQVETANRMLQQAAAEKEARVELSLKTRDGATLPYEVNCRYVLYLGENCYLCVARDITRTKLLQSQLIRSERLAATGQLAASIAHEINSPLQGIAALLNVLRTTYEGDDYLQRKLDLIKSAFNSIRDTVRNLIDLNRPGKERKQLIDVNQVVENTMALVKSMLKKHMIAADVALDAHNPVLNASPQQMGQVIMNLVNNAVEAITGAPGPAAPEGPAYGTLGRISVRTYNRDQDLVIELKDTGPGIADAEIDRIFDPFFTSKKTMGMGVGLTICHGIIEDHQGRLTAANAAGGGAVFTIVLPMPGPETPAEEGKKELG
jgi:PAS domain S-box-containing protein